jgi:hypothetical protein
MARIKPRQALKGVFAAQLTIIYKGPVCHLTVLSVCGPLFSGETGVLGSQGRLNTSGNKTEPTGV